MHNVRIQYIPTLYENSQIEILSSKNVISVYNYLVIVKLAVKHEQNCKLTKFQAQFDPEIVQNVVTWY